MYVCMGICTCMYLRACKQFCCIEYVVEYVCMYVYLYVRACLCVCAYTYIHIYMYHKILLHHLCCCINVCVYAIHTQTHNLHPTQTQLRTYIYMNTCRCIQFTCNSPPNNTCVVRLSFHCIWTAQEKFHQKCVMIYVCVHIRVCVCVYIYIYIYIYIVCLSFHCI
jgi:hypothetical protein